MSNFAQVWYKRFINVSVVNVLHRFRNSMARNLKIHRRPTCTRFWKTLLQLMNYWRREVTLLKGTQRKLITQWVYHWPSKAQGELFGHQIICNGMCKATEYVGYCIEVIFKAEVFAGVTKFKFKIIKIHRMLYMVNMEVKAIG